MSEAEGSEALVPFLGNPEKAGVFSDFDGTLADIVLEPAEARPRRGAVEVLGALAARYARVGVVSGRPAEFLRSHLGAPGVCLWGLYGLEWADEGGITEHEEAARWRPVVAEVVDMAGADELAGVAVESKGLTVVLHFRSEPTAEAAAQEWAQAQAARTGLVLEAGRMSLELRPPIESDKGTVVSREAAGLAAVCFIGDDRGDLAAFDALDRLAGAGATALRVGVMSEEAPRELLERADLVVDGPAEVVRFLERLVP